jgi:hypothetical protein
MGHHTLLYYCYLFSEEETEKGLTQHEKAKKFGSRAQTAKKEFLGLCWGKKFSHFNTYNKAQTLWRSRETCRNRRGTRTACPLVVVVVVVVIIIMIKGYK